MVVVPRTAVQLLVAVLTGCGWLLVCQSAPILAAQEQSGAAGALRKIKDVSPVYPEMARQARVEGTVVVDITVGTDGRVASARVRRSVPLLDQAALEAVRQWVYDARGMSAPETMTVSVPFSLADGPADKGGAPASPQAGRSGSGAPPAIGTPAAVGASTRRPGSPLSRSARWLAEGLVMLDRDLAVAPDAYVREWEQRLDAIKELCGSIVLKQNIAHWLAVNYGNVREGGPTLSTYADTFIETMPRMATKCTNENTNSRMEGLTESFNQRIAQGQRWPQHERKF